MTSDEIRYLFDLQGFVVLPNVLDSGRVARMNEALRQQGFLTNPENNPGKSRFQFLDLGADFHGLIDHPQILPVLQELIVRLTRVAPSPLIFSYNSEKSLCGTGPEAACGPRVRAGYEYARGGRRRRPASRRRDV
jgi:hypothetical protein